MKYDKIAKEDPTKIKHPGLDGAVIYGETICEGLSVYVYEACKNANIPVRLITMMSVKKDDPTDQVGHAYNEVYLNGKWHTVDLAFSANKESLAYGIPKKEQKYSKTK